MKKLVNGGITIEVAETSVEFYKRLGYVEEIPQPKQELKPEETAKTEEKPSKGRAKK